MKLALNQNRLTINVNDDLTLEGPTTGPCHFRERDFDEIAAALNGFKGTATFIDSNTIIVDGFLRLNRANPHTYVAPAWTILHGGSWKYLLYEGDYNDAIIAAADFLRNKAKRN